MTGFKIYEGNLTTLPNPFWGYSITAFLIISFLVFGLFFSFPPLVVFGALLIGFSSDGRKTQQMFLLSGACFLGIFALLKEIESDQYFYLALLKLIQNEGVIALVNSPYLSFRASEPLFIIYMALIALTGPLAGPLFVFLSTSIVYLGIGAGVKKLCEEDHWKALAAIIFILLIAINFSSVGHLTRQYLAFAVFFYALILNLRKFSYFHLVLMGASALIHNSSLLLIVFYVFGVIFRKNAILGIVLLVIAYFVAQPYIFLAKEISKTFYLNDGSIPITFIALDVTLVCSWIIVSVLTGGLKNSDKILLGMILNLTVFLILTADLTLVFLRMYVTMDFLRAIVFALLIKRCTIQNPKAFIVGLTGLGVVLFIYRLNSSPWKYGGEHDPILYSLIDIFRRISEVYN